MLNDNLFPQGHAVGSAFCGRSEERKQLAHAFHHNEHLVIVAPRRYGKSSLIKQVLLETKLPGKRIDLLPATSGNFVQKAIKLAFTDIVNQIAPKTKQAKLKIIEMIRNLCPKLTLRLLGQSLEVSMSRDFEIEIVDMLISLNAIAEKVKKRVILCFDEFQQIGRLKDNHSIEASIRHAVECSHFVTYVFSGSNRHLLRQMFMERSRPLYHLCDLIEIDRITAEEYIPTLNARAKKRFVGADIKATSISEILALTKCHPYYVNALCRKLWKENTFPSASKIQKVWFDYVDMQSRWISDDIARLSPIQRNILAALAFEPTNEPLSTAFTQKVKIAASTVKKSLDILVKTDLVYQTKDKKYHVLDPALEAYLQNIPHFDFVAD